MTTIDRRITQHPLAERGVTVVVPGDEAWPTALDRISSDDRPPALWVSGNPALLTDARTRVAVVGTRGATAYGTTVAGEVAADLARTGHIVTTEAAVGIGAAALRGVLTTRQPAIVLLAHGLSHPAHEATAALLAAAARDGAVVSFCPPETAPSRARVRQRARLLATLSDATLLMEAGGRSAALNTAYDALRLGRVVAAVPGPVTSVASAGCHRLIQHGETHLVIEAADLIDALADRR